MEGEEARQRRLLWWGGGGGGGEEPKVETVGAGPEKNEGALQAKLEQLRARQGPDGGFATGVGAGGAGFGGAAGERLQKAMRPVGAKVPNVPLSDKVDLRAPGEGVLWQPTSMTGLECPRGGDGFADPDGCDATVRFCLMKVGEYQETPWKFPMATMLQKRSGCSKSANVRAFRLSALRVR